MAAVSFLLVLVVFLYQINYETGYVFAKPLILVLLAILFILYGVVVQVISLLKFSEKLFYISLSAYIASLVILMLAVLYLLVGVRGLNYSSIFHLARVTAWSVTLVVMLPLLIGYFIYTIYKKSS